MKDLINVTSPGDKTNLTGGDMQNAYTDTDFKKDRVRKKKKDVYGIGEGRNMGFKNYLLEYYMFLSNPDSETDEEDLEYSDKYKVDNIADDVDERLKTKYHPLNIRKWMELSIAGDD